MKSAVVASIATVTSFNAWFVQVAGRVLLADQPVSPSVSTSNGPSEVASLPSADLDATAVDVGAYATCTSIGRRRAKEQPGDARLRKCASTAGTSSGFTAMLGKALQIEGCREDVLSRVDDAVGVGRAIRIGTDRLEASAFLKIAPV